MRPLRQRWLGQSSYDAPLEVRNCRSGQVEQLSFEQTAADPRQAVGNSNLSKISGVIVFEFVDRHQELPRQQRGGRRDRCLRVRICADPDRKPVPQ